MRSFILVLVPLMLLCLSGRTRGADDDAEKNAVRSVLDKYTKACEQRDFALLSPVFSHGQDLVLINVGPGPGSVVGWASVAALYKGLFAASDGVRMQHTDVSVKILAAGSAACVTCNQQVEWVLQGKSYGREGVRTTYVLEKRQGQWRIVHAHWSLPATEEPKARE